MSEKVLSEIRAEIAQREAALERWRELERAALDLAGATASARQPEAPAKPPADAPPVPARRRGAPPSGARRSRGHGANDRREEILRLLEARGPLGPGEVAGALGLDRSSIARKIGPLLEDGRVVARGKTNDRTYAATMPIGPAASAPSASKISRRVRKLEEEARAKGNGQVEYEDELLELLQRIGGRVALSELEHQLRRKHGTCDRTELEHATSRLVTHGLVIRDDGGGLRATGPSPERPLEAVAADVAGVESL